MLKRILTVEGYELITMQQAAKLCGVTFATIYKWVKDERLPIRAEVGRVKLLDKKEVISASESYQKTKPRTGGKLKTVKNLEGKAA